ncbi:unnamed protein product, partial [Thlaspi arvense]
MYELREMYNFAELETGGRRVKCPRCHAPFTPHLGHLVTSRFHCENCKGNLSVGRSITGGGQVRCPCCNYSRPIPSLKALLCGGCNVTLIYRKDDRAVKCSHCKHISDPHVKSLFFSYHFATLSNSPNDPQLNRIVHPQVNLIVHPQVNRVGNPQVNRVGHPQVNCILHPQVNRVVHPQVNRVGHPQVNRVGHPQVIRVGHPQVNRVGHPQVNCILHPQVNRVVPRHVNRWVIHPQFNRVVPHVNRMNRSATAETESTASSSFVVSNVRNVVARGSGTIKREAEEDKTEAKSKKI